MGYTHYWDRPEMIEPETFRKVALDIKFLIERLIEYGLPLVCQITEDNITFNGVQNCGHTHRDLGITWPLSKSDAGSKSYTGATLNQTLAQSFGEHNVIGASGCDIEREGYPAWYAGALLSRRECNGDCSHESFDIPIEVEQLEWERNTVMKQVKTSVFQLCKTAYKPYDIAVTAALIILKYHCPEIQVRSDGESEHWDDARLICSEWLGYGSDFQLDSQ